MNTEAFRWPRSKVVWPAIFLLLAVLAGQANARERGNFNHQVPDVRGYRVVNEASFDVNKNGNKETWSILYQNNRGEEAMSLSKGKNGPIYGWTKWNRNQDKNDLFYNYTIIKSSRGGNFDSKIRTSDPIPIPDWVESK